MGAGRFMSGMIGPLRGNGLGLGDRGPMPGRY